MRFAPPTCILLGLLAVLPSLPSAAVRHVPAQYSTIQGAVTAASPGDTVLVSPGTYLENVYVPKRVALLSVDGPEVTTIDGQGLAPVVLVEWNVDHASVEGFRITHGYDQSFYLAAGIDIEVQVPSMGGQATIRGNIIEYNRSNYGAAGIFAVKNSIVVDNIIQYNNRPGANSYASAMQVSGIVERNVIRHNGMGDGSVVWLNGTTTFAWNTITDSVGFVVVRVWNGGSIHHNTIVDNWGNPAVDLERDGPFDFRNNIIVHGNEPGLYCDVTGSLVVECNDVWGAGASYTGGCAGMAAVDGNISADPLVCSVDDFHLQAGSPCLPENSPAGCGLIGALGPCNVLAVNDPTEAPSLARLEVSPNPSSGAVVFLLPGVTTPHTLEIFDAHGRQVDVLRPMAGQITWTPSRNLTRGIYFARITSPSPEVVKFVLLR